MIINTVHDLFDLLDNYPKKIVYFDKTDNIEDTVTWETDSYVVTEFFNKYSDYTLVNFTISNMVFSEGFEIYIEMKA